VSGTFPADLQQALRQITFLLAAHPLQPLFDRLLNRRSHAFSRQLSQFPGQAMRLLALDI
jgi:hypothetical protein